MVDPRKFYRNREPGNIFDGHDDAFEGDGAFGSSDQLYDDGLDIYEGLEISDEYHTERHQRLDEDDLDPQELDFD